VNERRTTRRETAACPLDVLDPRDRLVGCMADLSVGGMRICRIADPDDCMFTELTLELPRWTGLARTLALPGRFVWFREGAQGLEAGFMFDELPRRKAETLALLVERLSEMRAEVAGETEPASAALR